jgi:hypothetical protein
LRRHLDPDAPDLLLSVSEQSGPDGADLGMSVFFLSKVAKLSGGSRAFLRSPTPIQG